MRKEFEKDEYDKFDKLAKDIVRKQLDSHGSFTLINEDYKADIKAIRVEAHEVEVKKGWIGEWPKEWKDLHIPERKGKLLKDNKFMYFWVISGDLKRALVVEGRHLKPYFLKEVPNIKIARGEKFYCIPLFLCSKIKIKNFIEKK